MANSPINYPLLIILTPNAKAAGIYVRLLGFSYDNVCVFPNSIHNNGWTTQL